MRRSELIARLVALGWHFDRMSGSRHELWRHPTKRDLLFVPTSDIVAVATAEGILDKAVR
jgi:predicted RNA binding protein YcfA (HicA-like mRNA interferase family)